MRTACNILQVDSRGQGFMCSKPCQYLEEGPYVDDANALAR